MNKVSQLTCSVCKKKGHTAAQCWKAKAKGKGKGGDPKGKSNGTKDEEARQRAKMAPKEDATPAVATTLNPIAQN